MANYFDATLLKITFFFASVPLKYYIYYIQYCKKKLSSNSVKFDIGF